ncbi:MAG: zinc-ribbon domain-containing protein, partial [Armatimonadetes bacterium]|nr:zinc-ribbon domain-containing protein [Armatimonadota bacterium]NIO96267.1 zinc-ribbon domain-containing protein [Armatimonadota bacterium]
MESVSCPFCKAEVPPQAKFCTNCGEVLSKPAAASLPAPSSESQEAGGNTCDRCGHVHQQPIPTHCLACGFP